MGYMRNKRGRYAMGSPWGRSPSVRKGSPSRTTTTDVVLNNALGMKTSLTGWADVASIFKFVDEERNPRRC